MENWVQINTLPGCLDIQDCYFINQLGYVKGRRVGFLKHQVGGSGYKQVNLRTVEKKQSTKSIHSLVALAFIPGYKEGLVVNHIDENKHNNSLENLEWITQAKNNAHGTRVQRQAKTRGHAIKGIDIETGEVVCQFYSMWEAQRNGYNATCISNVVRGKQKTHANLKWEYV